MSQEYIWLADKLQGEYKDAFQRVEVYASTKRIDEEYDSESMMNLLDLLLTAQEEGDPVEKIIGKDLKKFCETYFSGYGIRERAGSIPRKIYQICKVIFILEIIFTIFDSTEENFNLFTAKTNMFGYLGGVVIGLMITTIVFEITKPLLFKLKRFNSTVFYSIFLFIFIGALILFIVFFGEYSLLLPLLPILLITGIYILIYKTVELVKRYRKTGTIRKIKDDTKIGFKNMVQETFNEGYKNTIETDLPIMLKKRYDKINKRRRKSGKPILTKQGYMEKLQKENKQTAFMNSLISVIIFLFVIGMIIYVAKDSTVVDTIIFATILIGIETLIMYGFRKSMGPAEKFRVKLIDECVERGITIIDYVEMRQEEQKKDTDEAARIESDKQEPEGKKTE